MLIVCVTFSAPTLSVQINDTGATPIAGEDNYQLICSVSGAENLNPTITYRWTKNSGGGQTQLGASSSILSFTPLPNAASYVCGVTVHSSYLASDIIAMNSLDIRLQCELIANNHKVGNFQGDLFQFSPKASL